jgi:phage shock protein A
MEQLQIATKKLLDSTSTLQNETAVLKEHYQQHLSENLQMKNKISQLETNITLHNQTKSNLSPPPVEGPKKSVRK